MQGLKIDGQNLTGESWDPLTDKWVPFQLDLITGQSVGGSFRDWQAT